jgi:hypothetical protein
MSDEVKKEICLEVAHGLFMNVVGFSKLLIDDQSEILEQLNQLVRGNGAFPRSRSGRQTDSNSPAIDGGWPSRCKVQYSARTAPER